MKRLFSMLFTLLFCAAMTLAASAQEKTGSDMSNSGKQSAGMGDTDTTFVQKAAQGGLAEVELGQLAVQKASSEDVKKFGQRMVDDHTKANDQLKRLAAQEHRDLPEHPAAKDRQAKARLEKLSGAQFDKVYMRDMVKDHQKDVAEFERESKMAKDPAVKSFAEQTLPTLKEHLKEAEKIAPKSQTAKTTGE
jgi:putative membrane protein